MEEDFQVPYDIVFSILSFLPPQDIISCRVVAKEWMEICKKYEFLRKSCVGRYPSAKFLIPKDEKDEKKWISLSNRYIHHENNFWNKKHDFFTLKGHTSDIISVSINQISLLASGGKDSNLILYNLEKAQTIGGIKLNDNVGCVKLLNDKLFSGSDDGELNYFSIDNQGMKKVVSFRSDQPVKCLCTQLQPNGVDSIVFAGVYSNILGYDTKSGDLSFTLKGHTQAVSALCFNEEINEYDCFGEILDPNWYMVSASYDKTIRLWDLRKQSCVRTMRGHQKAIKCVQLRGERIISGASFGDKEMVRVWCSKSGEQVRAINTNMDNIHSIKFDSYHMAISGDNKLNLYNSIEEDPFWEISYEDSEVKDVAFNEKFMAVASTSEWNVSIFKF